MEFSVGIPQRIISTSEHRCYHLELTSSCYTKVETVGKQKRTRPDLDVFQQQAVIKNSVLLVPGSGDVYPSRGKIDIIIYPIVKRNIFSWGNHHPLQHERCLHWE